MGQRILVAEDEKVFASDLRDTVEEAGYEVEGPHTGTSSALLACEGNRPDLAILDATLGGDDSYRLAHKLTEDSIPIIFHTASKGDAIIAERFPGAMTVPKPCPPATMLAAVSGALGHRGRA